MPNLRLKISLILMFGLMFGAIAIFSNLPISAHEVETSEDVGATLHIEPNDNPKAGELSQVWFALTREGGDPIPLDKCDCKLSVYPEPKSAQPILQPTLKPLSTEGYKNIPSAEINFPKVGIYNLEIVGKPIGGEDFKSFKLRFKVTVATAILSIPSTNSGFTAVNPDSDDALSENQFIPVITGVGIIAIAGVILILRINKK